MSWDKAHTSCLEKGGNLASILSEDDQREIEKATQGVYRNYWIGGRKLNADEDSFRWTDGSPRSEYNNYYSWYKPYHAYRCLYIYYGWWYLTYCHYYRAYVCKLPTITPSQDLYQLSSYNLSQSVDFYMDVSNDSLGGREVPGFKVVLTIEEENNFFFESFTSRWIGRFKGVHPPTREQR